MSIPEEIKRREMDSIMNNVITLKSAWTYKACLLPADMSQTVVMIKMRKQTVEPVFGIIKQIFGFRTFMLRGLKKVSTEFELVKSAYNIKRLFNLMKVPASASM